MYMTLYCFSLLVITGMLETDTHPTDTATDPAVVVCDTIQRVGGSLCEVLTSAFTCYAR